MFQPVEATMEYHHTENDKTPLLLNHKNFMASSPSADFLKSLKSQVESVIKQIEDIAAKEAQRAREIKDSYEAERAALEATLHEKEQALLTKDSAIRELQETPTGKVQELESLLGEKEALLKDLNTELKQKELLIKAKDEAIVKLRGLMSAEIQTLTSQLKEKKIALASYEKSHWRSIGRRNFWKRFFHWPRSEPSAKSVNLEHSDTDERTALSTPPAKLLVDLENSMESPNYIEDPQQQETTKHENSKKPKKVVNLRF